MKSFVCFLFGILFFGQLVLAQPSFTDVQKSYPRVANAVKQQEDTIRRQFQALGLNWPVHEIYIRSFKYDSQLELWARNNDEDPFKLVKTYKVCVLAGDLGPKRIQGDYQVPEGFYYINEFNPKSSYHLSLGINYPNPSDILLSDSLRPGGEIYIHGSCVSTGCIPILDKIEELYVIAATAKGGGQDFIPVHIFPVRFDNEKSRDYLDQKTKTNQSIIKFANSLKAVYDYFEKKKQLPLISINKNGEYEILN